VSTDPHQPTVAVVGSSGFVGSHVVRALSAGGAMVRQVRAPRLATSARQCDALLADTRSDVLSSLDGALDGADVVINTAGVADAGASDTDDLYGANALLPLLVAQACSVLGTRRFVHLSSAAVQGRTRRLRESADVAPFSPYSRSKALAEEALAAHAPRTVLFRATSVHGRGRPTTERLVRLAGSRWASVAGAGSDPTPQVLVENLASAIAFVATTDRPVPSVVLQPGEGLTTGSLITVLGGRPRRVPRPVARPLVGAGAAAGRLWPRAAGVARRLEMLWFGQDQEPGWLSENGWKPPLDRRGWEALR
jgi:UDP-glucose 4-epimerase